MKPAQGGNKGRSFSLLIAGMAVGTVLVTTLALFFVAYRMGSDAIEREALRTVGAYAEGTHRALVNRLALQRDRARMMIENAWNQCNDGPEKEIEPCLRRVMAQFMEVHRVEAVFLEFDNGRQLRLGNGGESLRFIPGMPEAQMAALTPPGAPKGHYIVQAENRAVAGRIVLLAKTAELDPVFANLSYVGQAGEAFLVDRDGYFVTPPKYHSSEGISHPIDAAPMQACLSPGNGQMTAPDYRHINVIHGFRYVPEIGGGCIMVHIDHGEAMAGLSRFTFRWFNVAALLLVLFGIASYLTSLRLTEYLLGPLSSLTRRIGMATNGELAEPSALQGPRELVELSQSLQRYAERTEATHKKQAERERNTQSALHTKAISDMSHELKTPLTAIMALSRMMDGHNLGEEEARFVKMIHSAGGQLLALIDNSLDMAKLEAGKLKMERAELDLAVNVNEVISLLGTIAETKGYRLRLELSMPEADITGPRFYGDPLRLRQILMNLIGNAIKFTSRGGVTLKLFELARGAAPHMRLFRFEVADTGPGLTPAQMRNIFTRFGQADETVAARHGGSGLGLVISKELVELMGGRIGVESEPGKGSTFWFELPFEEKSL